MIFETDGIQDDSRGVQGLKKVYPPHRAAIQ